MKKQQVLKQVIASEVKSLLKEDYARGIPDFALSQVASDATEGLKRHLRKHINQMASDPAKQRQMLAAANEVLRETEKEMKELLEDKLLKFVRSV
jgi:heme oxygenase